MRLLTLTDCCKYHLVYNNTSRTWQTRPGTGTGTSSIQKGGIRGDRREHHVKELPLTGYAGKGVGGSLNNDAHAAAGSQVSSNTGGAGSMRRNNREVFVPDLLMIRRKESDDDDADDESGDRRARRAAHGSSEGSSPCAERKRRGAHGASAVCAAIGATMPKPIGSMQQVLFNADLIETFGIHDADFTEEQEQSCVEQFGDIVGSASAALHGGKDRLSRRLSRRLSHGGGGSMMMMDAKSCTVLFANTICKAAVADEGLRSRRGAHSASAMCRKIVESAASKGLTPPEILFDANVVDRFGIKFTPIVEADLARCQEDFTNIVGAFVASTNGKPMMDDGGGRRDRRGAHGPMCLNLFANQICVAAIASESGGGSNAMDTDDPCRASDEPVDGRSGACKDQAPTSFQNSDKHGTYSCAELADAGHCNRAEDGNQIKQECPVSCNACEDWPGTSSSRSRHVSRRSKRPATEGNTSSEEELAFSYSRRTRAEDVCLDRDQVDFGVAVSGACAVHSASNGIYLYQGMTLDGRAYYMNENVRYIYYDKDCDGGEEDGVDRWIIGSSSPSTSAAADLDLDGDCRFYAYIDSSSQTIPTEETVWRMSCENGWTDVTLKIASQDGIGEIDSLACKDLAREGHCPRSTVVETQCPESCNVADICKQRHVNNNLKTQVDEWLKDEDIARKKYGDIKGWDVSGVTDMSTLFESASAFNSDLSGWNVSAVTDMSRMFYSADAFNADLNGWDVSAVTDMSRMFFSADAFNADLGSWDVSAVTDMTRMFNYAHAFNSDLRGWDVSAVTDMSGMFNYAAAFNSDLRGWNVSAVNDMSRMFYYAGAFNADLGGWDVSAVNDMSFMFYYAGAFNADLGSWDVSAVKGMSRMFNSADAFNTDLGSWDVSAVNDMSFMFYYAGAFNQDLGSWYFKPGQTVNVASMFTGAKKNRCEVEAPGTFAEEGDNRKSIAYRMYCNLKTKKKDGATCSSGGSSSNSSNAEADSECDAGVCRSARCCSYRSSVQARAALGNDTTTTKRTCTVCTNTGECFAPPTLTPGFRAALSTIELEDGEKQEDTEKKFPTHFVAGKTRKIQWKTSNNVKTLSTSDATFKLRWVSKSTAAAETTELQVGHQPPSESGNSSIWDPEASSVAGPGGFEI
eukprot:gene8149-24804_t